jgi:hypothetical protein
MPPIEIDRDAAANSEALAALLGAGVSASAIGCKGLKDRWLDEHTARQRRDLSAERYVYIVSLRRVPPSSIASFRRV